MAPKKKVSMKNTRSASEINKMNRGQLLVLLAKHGMSESDFDEFPTLSELRQMVIKLYQSPRVSTPAQPIKTPAKRISTPAERFLTPPERIPTPVRPKRGKQSAQQIVPRPLPDVAKMNRAQLLVKLNKFGVNRQEVQTLPIDTLRALLKEKLMEVLPDVSPRQPRISLQQAGPRPFPDVAKMSRAQLLAKLKKFGVNRQEVQALPIDTLRALLKEKLLSPTVTPRISSPPRFSSPPQPSSPALPAPSSVSSPFFTPHSSPRHFSPQLSPNTAELEKLDAKREKIDAELKDLEAELEHLRKEYAEESSGGSNQFCTIM